MTVQPSKWAGDGGCGSCDFESPWRGEGLRGWLSAAEGDKGRQGAQTEEASACELGGVSGGGEACACTLTSAQVCVRISGLCRVGRLSRDFMKWRG